MTTHTLCHIDDINEGAAKSFVLANKETVFGIKKEGVVFIYKNSCPHLGIELEWQENQFLDNEGALIQCSTHGALFIIESGECVSGPCLGKALSTVPFSINGGMLVIHFPD